MLINGQKKVFLTISVKFTMDDDNIGDFSSFIENSNLINENNVVYSESFTTNDESFRNIEANSNDYNLAYINNSISNMRVTLPSLEDDLHYNSSTEDSYNFYESNRNDDCEWKYSESDVIEEDAVKIADEEDVCIESDETIHNKNEAVQNEIYATVNELIKKTKFKRDKYIINIKRPKITKVKKTNNYIKANKIVITKLFELQNEIQLRCFDCHKLSCITNVCRIKDDADRVICKNCSVKYNSKQLKDLNDNISNSFKVKCNKCHAWKSLLKMLRKDKGKNEIVYRQCNLCCLKKHLNDSS